MIAPLGVNILLQVTGQRRDNLHLVRRQKFRQICVAGRTENRQIAAINHVTAQAMRLLDHPTEMRVHFRSSPGKV